VGSNPAVRTNMPSDTPLLEADSLHLWRGERHVLADLGFALGAGQCLTVSGPNGAGKSSLLRSLAGLLPLESGTVRWRGADARHDPFTYHAELAWLGHSTALKADLTARENLLYSAGLRRTFVPGEIDAALATVGYLQPDQPLARQMSAGQQRRVALARVLLLAATLWLLDEPTSNLDEGGQTMFRQMLLAHLEQGGLAVVATHQPLQLPAGRLQKLELS
jgi:heme exporter protein A